MLCDRGAIDDVERCKTRATLCLASGIRLRPMYAGDVPAATCRFAITAEPAAALMAYVDMAADMALVRAETTITFIAHDLVTRSLRLFKALELPFSAARASCIPFFSGYGSRHE